MSSSDSKQAVDPGKPLDRIRVLVVDDDEGNATLLTRLLEHSGHDVRMANDGPTAIDLARDYQPEFVLLDIGLPGMDGFEVARRLRTQHTVAGLQLVAVSGYEKEDEGPNAGIFDHWLVKPVPLVALQKLIGRS